MKQPYKSYQNHYWFDLKNGSYKVQNRLVSQTDPFPPGFFCKSGEGGFSLAVSVILSSNVNYPFRNKLFSMVHES